MIVGTGLMATGLQTVSKENPALIFFASGVSNSKNEDLSLFTRERDLLQAYLEDKKRIVYFSTMSVYDPLRNKSKYVQHKLEMERLITKNLNFTIFRLPEVVGKSNNTETLVNFLYRKIMSGEKFQLWKNVRRNLIDVSDVQAQISIILRDNLALNNVVNICSDRDHTAAELVGVLEKVTGRVARYDTVENLEDHDHPAVIVKNEHYTSVLGTNDGYLELVLRKYYA